MSLEEMEQGLGARRLRSRWVVTATLRSLAPLHLGGGTGQQDLSVVRDLAGDDPSRPGEPLLLGSTLAGALRSHLTDRLAGYGSAEPPEVGALFGAARAAPDGEQSAVVTFDSRAARAASSIRDGVALDPETGLAVSGSRFDAELLEPGAEFPIRVDLLVPEDGDEAQLLALLGAALEGLCEEGGREATSRLGMRRSRGWGAVRAGDWRAERFDLSSAGGWLGWLASDHERPLAGRPSRAGPAGAISEAWPGAGSWEVGDVRLRSVIDLELHFPLGLLLGGIPIDPAAPDTVAQTAAGVPVLTGTGLAGALRARTLRYARLLLLPSPEDAVGELFGPRSDAEGAALAASRVRVAEVALVGGIPARQARISLDRVTGGVMPGALFDQEPLYGSRAAVRLEVRFRYDEAPADRDRRLGLLLLAVKDLLSGQLALGGGAAIGRGIGRGTGMLSTEDGRAVPLVPGQADAELDRLLRAAGGTSRSAQVPA